MQRKVHIFIPILLMKNDLEEDESWGGVPLNSVLSLLGRCGQHRAMFDEKDDNPLKIRERKTIRELCESITGMCKDQIRRIKM